MYEMYSNWPCRRRCSDGIRSRVCPSDGSNDDDDDNDVTTLEEKECALHDPNDKVGNTAPVGRRPCAVYGYELAVQPSAVINNSSSLLPHSNVSGLEHEYHHATLDGLCQHGHPGLIMSACHRETIGIDSRERIETR